MSVLIKNIKKPSNCFECRFSDGAWCNAQDKRNWRQAYHIPQTGISETCPLIEMGEDVQMVVHGHWSDYYFHPCGNRGKCSACGKYNIPTNYCPECGAKMDESEGEK